MRFLATGLGLICLVLAGCASDGYSSGSSSVSVGASFYYGAGWYGGTYYPYGPPGYVVVPPDYANRPGEPGRPVGPEQPIAKPQPVGPSQLPATSSGSRMPSAQPRMSSSSSRASIPRASRGGRR